MGTSSRGGCTTRPKTRRTPSRDSSSTTIPTVRPLRCPVSPRLSLLSLSSLICLVCILVFDFFRISSLRSIIFFSFCTFLSFPIYGNSLFCSPLLPFFFSQLRVLAPDNLSFCIFILTPITLLLFSVYHFDSSLPLAPLLRSSKNGKKKNLFSLSPLAHDHFSMLHKITIPIPQLSYCHS